MEITLTSEQAITLYSEMTDERYIGAHNEYFGAMCNYSQLIHPNGADFFENLYSIKSAEDTIRLLRDVQYGKYNIDDTYVRIDGANHLQSADNLRMGGFTNPSTMVEVFEFALNVAGDKFITALYNDLKEEGVL